MCTNAAICDHPLKYSLNTQKNCFATLLCVIKRCQSDIQAVQFSCQSFKEN